MRIITPTEIEHVAWEGYLEPADASFKGSARARVTLGEPAWWSAAEAMESETGRKWSPPADAHQRSYSLVRLACTLHPTDDSNTRYTEARLTAYLRSHHASSGAVLAHDLYPQRLTAETSGKHTIGLSPELKFADAVEVSLFSLATEIEYHKVFAVVQGYGLGESHPYWQFAGHEASPLLGCQSVYAVLSAPWDAGGVRLSVELVATLETRFGPIRVGLPEEARANLSRSVGIET